MRFVDFLSLQKSPSKEVIDRQQFHFQFDSDFSEQSLSIRTLHRLATTKHSYIVTGVQ